MSLVRRINLLLNPVSSTVSATTNWAVLRVTLAVGTGLIQATITDANPINLAQRMTLNPRVSATPGETYSVQAEIRSNVAGASMAVASQFFNSGGGFIAGSSTQTSAAVNNSSFTNIAHTATAPSGTATVLVMAAIPGTGARNVGEVFDVRRFIVEGGTSGAYFDGGIPADGEYVYAWSGTADASTSIAQSKLRRELEQGSLTQAAVRAATF